MRKWEDWEVEFLKKNYDKMSARDIARVLKRTVASVLLKAHKLGLKKKRKFGRWSLVDKIINEVNGDEPQEEVE